MNIQIALATVHYTKELKTLLYLKAIENHFCGAVFLPLIASSDCRHAKATLCIKPIQECSWHPCLHIDGGRRCRVVKRPEETMGAASPRLMGEAPSRLFGHLQDTVCAAVQTPLTPRNTMFPGLMSVSQEDVSFNNKAYFPF